MVPISGIVTCQSEKISSMKASNSSSQLWVTIWLATKYGPSATQLCPLRRGAESDEQAEPRCVCQRESVVRTPQPEARVRRWRNVAVDSERGEKPLHANQKIEGGRHRGHLMVTYPTLPIEISAKKSRAFLGRQIENEGRRLSVAAPHDTGEIGRAHV